jgi:malonyl-CoA O-methyltransferase
VAGEGVVDLPTRQGYDSWAEIYDHDDNPLIALEAAEVARQLDEVRGLRIADLGCGTGRHALALAAAGAQVTAVDFSEGMLAKARAKPGAERVRFVQHDLETPLPLESAAFDRVTCCLVLDHVAELGGLFREMGRLCTAEGFVLISAMHPAIMLRGVQARFTDPATGRVTRPASVANQISDYVMAATRAGLTFDHLSEHAIDAALAARCPRAAKYLGWPLLLMMRLRP